MASVTGPYLTGKKAIPVPARRRPVKGRGSDQAQTQGGQEKEAGAKKAIAEVKPQATFHG